MTETIPAPGVESTPPPTNKPKAVIIGKFTGMLTPFALDLFHTLNVYGFKRELSHKIANDYMSQLGHAMKTDESLRARIGAIDANGHAGFKAAALKFNKVALHDSSAIAHAAYTLEDLFKAKIVVERANILKMFTFSESISAYITKSQAWCDAQEWTTAAEAEKDSHK